MPLIVIRHNERSDNEEHEERNSHLYLRFRLFGSQCTCRLETYLKDVPNQISGKDTDHEENDWDHIGSTSIRAAKIGNAWSEYNQKEIHKEDQYVDDELPKRLVPKVRCLALSGRAVRDVVTHPT